MMKQKTMLLFLGIATIAIAGCSPGYRLIRQAPLTVKGRTAVVLENVQFSQAAIGTIQSALSKRNQGDPATVDGWLKVPSTQLNNACSSWLTRAGYQVMPAGSRPQGPYVRARIEVITMFQGSRGGRALTILFGSAARGTHPRMHARINLYDGTSPQPCGEAQVQLEYNGGAEGFPILCRWIGERLGYYIRDSLQVAR
jgi:hypothetical protein